MRHTAQQIVKFSSLWSPAAVMEIDLLSYHVNTKANIGPKALIYHSITLSVSIFCSEIGSVITMTHHLPSLIGI